MTSCDSWTVHWEESRKLHDHIPLHFHASHAVVHLRKQGTWKNIISYALLDPGFLPVYRQRVAWGRQQPDVVIPDHHISPLTKAWPTRSRVPDPLLWFALHKAFNQRRGSIYFDYDNQGKFVHMYLTNEIRSRYKTQSHSWILNNLNQVNLDCLFICRKH